MTKRTVKQLPSYEDALIALARHKDVYAIDLDSFEKILDIQYHEFSNLQTLDENHEVVYIVIERTESNNEN